MVVKGDIRPDHIGTHNYTLSFVGVAALTPTSVTGLDEELDVVDLPDRTKATAGITKALEFTVSLPAHHLDQQAAMESWFIESQAGSPGYKKPGTLTLSSVTGNVTKSWTLIGCFTSGRNTPDLAMEDEGDLANIEWKMCADQLVPV